MPEDEEACVLWVQGLFRLALGVDLSGAMCRGIAERIRSSTLDPRVLIEECLRSEEFRHAG